MKNKVLKLAAFLGLRDYLADFVINRRAKKLYGRFISKGSLVFDVGGNVGNRTKLFNDLGAKVICIEPQQKCVEQLQSRFKDNEDIVIIPKGLSDKEEVITLYTSAASSVIATMSDKWKSEGRFAENTHWDESKEVEVTTLDTLIAGYGLPVFCKIDVEGFEKNVIRGLTHKIPVVSFEFTKEFLKDAIDCLNLLENLGPIEVNYSLGESMLFANQVFLSKEKCIAQITNNPDKLLWGDFYVKFLT